ncbi:MAG: prenyltransferase/squalene oxidase repeat-containing protein [Planctomycetota bacterium]
MMIRRCLAIVLGVTLSTMSSAADMTAEEVASAVQTGIDAIMNMEEGADAGEWPYEGVYRVRGNIPLGYRVGGTGICCLAIAMAPGFDDDADRQAAVTRGVRFILDARKDSRMTADDYQGGYDVRGWGFTYGALLMLRLQQMDRLPDGMEEDVKTGIAFYVDAIQRTAIPQVGGWNYARRRGKDTVAAPSSFMTCSTLQTLFLAADLGYDVDDDVIRKAIAFVKTAKAPSGEFVYSGRGSQRTGGVPGAIGRMTMAESTLFLAGEATAADVRGSIDAFIVHWEWLEKRRAQTGTHVAPYGVAPYYFYYAHLAAAQAIECLPEDERPEYRRRMQEALFRTRDDLGTWNDRVFERSANYGTAMSILALLTPDVGLVPAWSADAENVEDATTPSEQDS